MGFPVETEIIREGGDVTLFLVAPNENAYRIQIVQLTEDRLDEAIAFLVSQLIAREPLLLSLQQLTKRSPESDSLAKVLKEKYKADLSLSFIAIDATPNVSRFASPSSHSTIVGACFNVVSPISPLPSSSSSLSSISDPSLSYFVSNVPNPVKHTILAKAVCEASVHQKSSQDVAQCLSPPAVLQGSSVFEIGLVRKCLFPLDDISVHRLQLISTFVLAASEQVGNGLSNANFMRSFSRLGFILKAVETAQRKQCRFARCDSTNHYLTKALLAAKFRTVMDLSYPSFIDGDLPATDQHYPAVIETSYPHQSLKVLWLTI